MNRLCLTAAPLLLLSLAVPARAQTTLSPAGGSVTGPTGSAQTTPPAQTAIPGDDRGRKLLDQMVEALGGETWLNLQDVEEDGRVAAFFHGQPTGSNVQFFDYKHLPTQERIEYAKPRDIMPGSIRDVVEVWTPDKGYEVTYKGKKELLPKQIEDYNRLRRHSIRQVVQVWLKRPGVVVVAEGTSMVGRRIADRFTVLSPDNDAVTIETDQTTHLPMRRTFQWRNETFKDHDEDAEEYEDYHAIQGLPTPLSITRYHNGDMSNERFITHVEYGKAIPPERFDPDHLLTKK
jgi:hypothetical protein